MFLIRKNRKSIKENGLVLNNNHRFKDKRLKHKPAVFCSAIELSDYDIQLLMGRMDSLDIWRIDTYNIPNIWWLDLNEPKQTKERQWIMSYEPISKESLKLYQTIKIDYQNGKIVKKKYKLV